MVAISVLEGRPFTCTKILPNDTLRVADKFVPLRVHGSVEGNLLYLEYQSIIHCLVNPSFASSSPLLLAWRTLERANHHDEKYHFLSPRDAATRENAMLIASDGIKFRWTGAMEKFGIGFTVK